MSTIVVGAGVSGLTVAERLLRFAPELVILEKEPVVGGLCRSYRYNDFVFDIGPHRLFSANHDIHAYFLSILDGGYAVIPRCSQVFMMDKYLDWPLSMTALFRLPISFTWQCMRDLMNTNHHDAAELRNLAEYVVARYGATIYDLFWKDYTAKFLGIACTEVDAEWGAISVGRSVIDRKTKLGGLFDLARNAMVPRNRHLKFLYPDQGMGAFTDRWADRLRRQGCAVRVSQPIQRLEVEADRVTQVVTDAERLPVDRLVWTGSLVDLCLLLGEPVPPVDYLSTVLFNLEIEGELPGDWQWIYYPDARYVFSRVSRPVKFHAATAPPRKTGLCVEVACREGQDLWTRPEALSDRVVTTLRAVRLISTPGQVLNCHIERVRNTYPMYRIGYRAQVEAVHARLRKYRNLNLVGRQAAFVHDNIDEAVAESARNAGDALAAT